MATLSLAEQHNLCDQQVGWGLFVHREQHSCEPEIEADNKCFSCIIISKFNYFLPSYRTYYRRPLLQEPLSSFDLS